MSFYDDASLIMIPSGYKASKLYSAKPTDGSGDLTFSRTGSTATRVNESGLIEKCRTNQLTYSDQFNDASWSKITSSITQNSIANPVNSLVTADTLVLTGATTQKGISKSIALNGSFSFSIYLKYISHQYVQFLLGDDVTSYVNFDIQNGTVTSNVGGTSKIESVGNGWYRCSFSFNSTIAGDIFFIAIDSGTAGRYSSTSSTGSIYIFGAQMETGDIATDYIPTTSAAVTVGPIANLPRLDYTGGGCPKLLMEPTRTNLLPYSEQFDNAAWSKGNVTISQNNAISVDGYINSDRIIETTANGQHLFFRNSTVSNGTIYTFSVFLKAQERTSAAVQINDALNRYTVLFDLSFGTVLTARNIGSPLNTSNSIVNYGNGWYRCSVTINQSNATTMTAGVALSNSNSPTWNASDFPAYIGDITKGLLAYGAQLEAGSYATSYIPTVNASVTRNQDICSKTGISSLIGQTEGTIYAEFNLSNYNTVKALSTIDVGATTNFISISANSGSPRLTVRQSGSSSILISSSQLPFGNYKIAIGYKSGDYVMYINGVQIGTSTSTVYPVGDLTQYIINNASYGELTDAYNQTLLFKTRLFNADLATLTTI